MRAFYFFGQALNAMRRNLLVQASAIGAMTIALLLVGIAVLSWLNVDQLTAGWGRGVHVTVYLQPGISAERAARLQAVLQQRPEVASVALVSPRQAYQRLKRSLGARSSLLDDVQEDIFPTSLELRLTDQASHVTAPLLGVIETLPGVDDVDYLGRWASRLGTVAALLRAGALLIALIVALACLYIVASAVRLGVFARRQEIQIQRLVGATRSFIRAPFLIEGALQGLTSSALAMGLLYTIYRSVTPQIQAAFGTLVGQLDLSFLAPQQLLIGILAGVVLGLSGSSLACGAHSEP